MVLQCPSAWEMETAMDRCIFNLRLLQEHKTHCGNRHKAFYLVFPCWSQWLQGDFYLKGQDRVTPQIGKFSHVFTKCDSCCSPRCSGIWKLWYSSCLFCPVSAGGSVWNLHFIPVLIPPICCERGKLWLFNIPWFKGVPVSVSARLGQHLKGISVPWVTWNVSVQLPGGTAQLAHSQPCQQQQEVRNLWHQEQTALMHCLGTLGKTSQQNPGEIHALLKSERSLPVWYQTWLDPCSWVALPGVSTQEILLVSHRNNHHSAPLLQGQASPY